MSKWKAPVSTQHTAQKIAEDTSDSHSRKEPSSDGSEAPIKRRKLFSYMTRVTDRDPDFLPPVYPDVEEEIKKYMTEPCEDEETNP